MRGTEGEGEGRGGGARPDSPAGTTCRPSCRQGQRLFLFYRAILKLHNGLRRPASTIRS